MGLGPRRRGRWAGSGEHSSAVDTTPHEPFHHTWPPPRQSVRLAVPRLWTDCCTRSPDGTTCSHSALAGGSPDYGRSRMALTRLAPDPGQRGSNNVWGGTPEKRGLRAGTRCPGGQPGCTRPGQARVEPKSRERTPRFPNDDAQSQGRASAGASGRGRAAAETRVRSQRRPRRPAHSSERPLPTGSVVHVRGLNDWVREASCLWCPGPLSIAGLLGRVCVQQRPRWPRSHHRVCTSCRSPW